MYETVTDIDQLLDRLQSYQPDADLALVRKAYEFSAKAHEGQTRRSGEPYVKHPVAVAGVLTALKTDATAIVAGLLHDTLEDTVATADECPCCLVTLCVASIHRWRTPAIRWCR